jgi:ATP-binding cassette subfamily G (WHITE) protein 2
LKKEGLVTVNGVDRAKIRGFQAFSAYVQQDDILFQTMSVRECLEFAAKLKLSGSLESKLDRVKNIIEELRLTKC